MPTGARVDPYPSYNFTVEIGGVTRAAFQECSGLDSTVEITEYNEGGRNTPMKLAGLAKFANITLKWGLTDDPELYAWHRAAVDGNLERKDGSIVVRDRDGTEKVRWNFFNAWPTKWTAPAFNAETSAVAIETLELAHEGVVRA
jgi:phage tail-like protein